MIWFEQKVRITPELAADLKMLPLILLAGQIFAGVCFAAGLILICWYPLEQFWQRNKLHSHSIQKAENGTFKQNSASLEDLKVKNLYTDKPKSPDSSPLLDSHDKAIKVLPKSLTMDSVATTTSRITTSTRND